jgi:hypothetical protein
MSSITDYPGETVSALKKIDPSDLKFHPMQLNKRFTMLSGSTTLHTPLQAYYIDKVLETYVTGEQNSNGTYKTIIYKSIDQLFYKFNNSPTDLYQTSSIFSIPQKKMGQQIKNDSFTYSSASLNLASYSSGLVYDSNMITSSFPNTLVFYEGFNQYFNETKIAYTESQNVSYVDGVSTTGGKQQPIGLSALFSGNGYISRNIQGEYNKQKNYAISFFISGTNSANSDQLILSKADQLSRFPCPFNVELSGSNQIKFSIRGNNTNNIALITSSVDVSSSWTHVVCQKTGSDIELYINGEIHSSGSFDFLTDNLNTYVNSPSNISNNYNLNIGGYNTNNTNLQGYLDEIRIYNKGLTNLEISTLSDRSEGGGMLQTNIVGNVFSKKGFVIISTPDYRFNNLITSAYTASYESSITMYEMNSLCRINSGEFNVTQNHSALTENNNQYLNYLTGSIFTPYITSIGLYDPAGRLLAIGKLGQPIKKRDNVDMNILVRLDLDTKPFKTLNEITSSTNTITTNINTNTTSIPIATTSTSTGGGGY